MERILIIGSGPVVIGQGMEFDYAGTQAVLAYQKMGHQVFVLNSNPASIMSDLCQSYHKPMTVASILDIIEKDKITALAMSFGGQTALNLALELDQNATFRKKNIKILGTKITDIRKAEDREIFNKEISKLGYQMASSQIVTQANLDTVCQSITSFPVIIRPAYTLGGFGGGRCESLAQLKPMLEKALKASKIKQAVLEVDLSGLTELEFEVISDCYGFAKVVLDLENIDPVGVHTGDSHVVAPIISLPAQKVSEMKRQAETIAAHFQIIGSCNVQMAYDEKNDQVYVIEMNPRVSRSSALASKISSFPIAEYTAYLSLGKSLTILDHPVEKQRKAYEIKPLIYPAFKAPIWPFDLMPLADRHLGTQMKSVGEAMAMSNHLEGAMHQVFESIPLENYDAIDDDTLLKALQEVSDQRLAALLTLIKRDYDLDLLSQKTGIKRFFIAKMKQALSFSNDDFYFSSYEQNNKMISMNWKNEAIIKSDKKTILFIAPGPSKIGQGIEFDYALMKAMQSVQKMGYRAIVLNNNPATVSTDFNLADAVYFGALTIENIEKIVAAQENFAGIILQFGGQKAIDLAGAIENKNIKILGTSVLGIHMAEDRAKFKALLNTLHIQQAQSCVAKNMQEAFKLVQSLKYPLIVRPSFILAGRDMHIIEDEYALKQYLNTFTFAHPLLIDEYISGRECDVDIVYDGKCLIYSGAMEHIEKSGVHSGDSTLVYPAQNITAKQERAMKNIALKLAKHLKIRGILNIQFILNEKGIYVIEANPRASRTVPFLYKASGINIIDLAVKAILSQPLDFKEEKTSQVSLKFPVFSFEKLAGVDPLLGPSMKSTGEMMLQGNCLTEVYEQMLQARSLNLSHFKMVYLTKDTLALDELKAKGHEIIAYQEGIDFKDVDCVYCEMERTKMHYQLRRYAIEKDCLLLQNQEQIQTLIATLREWERHANI